LSIGLLGSSAGNQMFKDLFTNALKVYDPHKYQCVGVRNIYSLLYGPEIYNKDESIKWNMLARHNILQDIRDRWPDLKIFNIPFGQIYPFKCTEVDSIFDKTFELPEHIIALHWYAGNPMAQYYNGILNNRTVKTIRNTFTKVACRYV
jgi:hypothetical protein